MGPQLLAFFSSPRRRIAGLEPEDLAQMTLVRVYRSMEDFRHRASVRTWVLKIAVNVWSNALRDSKAAKRHGDEVSLDGSRQNGDPGPRAIDPRDPRDDPQQRLLDEERTRLLQEGLEELPTKMRRCMTLRLRDELTIRQIATLLRVEQTTVKSHLQEGHRRLVPILRERFGVTEPRGTAP